MPKSKEFVSTSDSDSDYEKPKTKKKKVETKPEKAKPEKASSSGGGGESRFQLSKMRFASASEFKGKKYVNIREYYEQDGDLRPGKKGIALNQDQWKKLKDCMEDIDTALDEL